MGAAVRQLPEGAPWAGLPYTFRRTPSLCSSAPPQMHNAPPRRVFSAPAASDFSPGILRARTTNACGIDPSYIRPDSPWLHYQGRRLLTCAACSPFPAFPMG
ncbi:Hypothetical predicted protein [Podarcis lilfordi]|uniref:Uncharacterized protein n=1 Tax=Podarcis lilfordi TaxID=74358 RepID=A0AA35P1V7_9SAUR|nr:Hypothetical predicted protein [Podarcis lilfordi]